MAIPSRVGAMSTSQKVVTTCVWEGKAGIIRLWVAGKTVIPLLHMGPYLSALAIVHYDALHKFSFFNCYLSYTDVKHVTSFTELSKPVRITHV